MADPIIYLDTPPKRNPRQGGLKALGPFVPTERLLGGADAINYLSDGCTFPAATRNGCFDGVVADADKTAVGVGIESGIGPTFARYAGVQCGIDDAEGSDYQARAERLLEAGESRSAELVLWTWARAASGGSATTAASVAAAIGQAEEIADATYIGQPVLLMSRSMAVLADEAGVLKRGDNGVPTTIHGTPVVATGQVAAADEDEIVAIGWPTVYESAGVTTATIHHTTNAQMAIAEKAYGLAVDCLFRHKVTVTTP